MTTRALELQRVLPDSVSRGVNALGEVFYRDEFFPLDHRHGRVRLESALTLHSNLLERLGPGLTQSDLSEAAYLDIETTGLSGGTEGYAFLVGVGTFEGYVFRVRQFFLADLAGEPAMLLALNETIERCRSVVTFNGRSFDMPRLAERYAMAGLPWPGEGLPHVDLLQPARRLFGKSLGSCRLSEIEQRLLGMKRFRDVSGALIPELYFAYLTRARVRGLDPLFEHNSLDVISLAAFVAYLSDIAGETTELEPEEHLALGRWDELSGRIESAMDQYCYAWWNDPSGEDGGEALWRLARMKGRLADWRTCLELWEEERRATASPKRLVRALIELAQLHERRLRAPQEALALAVLALESVQAAPSRSTFAKTRPLLEKRIARLEARCLRS